MDMKINTILPEIAILILFMLSLIPVAGAQSEQENFSQAQAIINQRVPYDQLTDDQFALLGDYFMELMAGSNHEYMDQMMGGEGSASLRQAHINMGMRFYQEYLDTGQIQQGGMMGYGMMGGYPEDAEPQAGMNYGKNYANYGMMGAGAGYMMLPGYGSYFWGLGVIGFLLLIAVVVFAVWIILRMAGVGRHRREQGPVDILNTRYAKGELKKRDYEKMKKEIKES